ncbi:uncharacterized protein LOC141641142 [Silene latifolia]|uniref:uncharacterized protein LOC141641142 n=1 Tax=Silene latifolia TaxID=37657 RepID=UPI003D7789AA
MDDFITCLNACGMLDIPATGAFFTWTNKQDATHRKYIRLDRFLVNQEWVDVFPDMHAHFHPEGLMDNNPCIFRNIKLEGRGYARFKYFNMWSNAPGFHDKIRNTWSQQINGTKMFGVVKKLKALKGVLKRLNKDCFSDVVLNSSKALMNLEKIQIQIQEDYANPDLVTLELQALAEVKFWSKARDSFLQHKAKTKWLDEGDSNTTYFHSVIKKRFLRNKIGLLGSKKIPEQVRREEVLLKGSFCNEDHGLTLSTPITKEEIKGVVFSTPIDKVPEPDGDEICNAIMDFFATGRLLTQINATNITLIPKYDRPTAVSHFRPIACCNLVYKVISKLLYNRLAYVLPDLVHENQGAFIKGRKAVTPRCLFKIELQKAYDTVEWDFVEQMLHGLKFPAHFTHLVMQCVRSTSFTLSLNGNNFGYFKGQRGLRQGDPISPLLFTICMEYLTRLIKFSTDRWSFQYQPLCKNLKLTHLMFADDLLLFCKGKPQSIWLLMRAFSSFSNAYGLSMNNAKSEIFFIGVNEDIREGIKELIGFKEGTMPFRNYLWDGSPDYHRVPLVAWDKVTLPKKEGGLGIKKVDVWNVARLVKDKLKDGFIDNIWTLSSKGYIIKGGYDWLCPAHTYHNCGASIHKLYLYYQSSAPPDTVVWGLFSNDGQLDYRDRNNIQWRIKRNNARINEWLLRPETVASRIEEDTKHRIKQKLGAVDDQTASLWLQNMGVI